MKVLIIDNNDSFTYNLKHYIQAFTQDIDVIRVGQLKMDYIDSYEKIIISPGPGLPSEYPSLSQLLSQFSDTKSILGICLGNQLISDFYGAELYNLKDVMHGVSTSLVHFSNCPLFNNLPKSIKVGHYHSWAVSESYFPDELEITSKNSDGIIMSVKHKEFDVRGLQFHPESILTDYGLMFIENWLQINQIQE